MKDFNNQSVITRRSALMVGLAGIAGCLHHEVEVDFSQFDRAMSRIDRMIETMDKGLADVRRESQQWRKSLAELETQLHEDSKDLVANEVRNTSDAFAKGLEDSVKGSTDYIESKLKDNLKAFRVALDRARTKVLKAKEKKDVNAIKEAFDELANIIVFPQPVVTGFIPAHVELDWKEYSQQSGYAVRVPLIEVRGWGFERPAEEAPRFGISIVNRDNDGKIMEERRLPLSALYITTRYMVQIKLDAPGVEFTPTDGALVFKLGSTSADLRFLPINHVRPEDPELVRRRKEAEEQRRKEEEERSRPKITEITLYVGTTWDDKDREITFHYTIHRKSDGKQVGGISVGGGEVWPDPKESKPDWRHFTIPINPEDRFKEAAHLGYRLHVRYESSNGDPKWNGRLRADAVLEGGRIITVLAETSDFDMGHIGGHPERVNRDFDFNR